MAASEKSTDNICVNEKLKSHKLTLKRKRNSTNVIDSMKPSKEMRLEKYQGESKGVSCEEAEYYFENGLRKVYPYYFDYSTFCKGRWVGKKLCDVFAYEFRSYTKEYYEKQILSELLKVNNSAVQPDYTLKDNDRITHKVHRHEVAVLASPIEIIFKSDDLIVIDKPPSIPVHPCGRYRYNTLLYILAKDYGLNNLHTIHRLDRLTSGILIFTKTLSKSQELDEYIRTHQIYKEYLCRVEGNFPDEVTCSEPLETLPRIGVCVISASGKESKTEFKKLSYNGKSSLVLCKPLTGRMHQIRVHLQFLGYPIINDPIYNHKNAFGPNKGKNGDFGKSREQLISDLMEVHHLDNWLKCGEDGADEDDNEKEINEKFNKILHHSRNVEEYKKLVEQYKKDPEKIIVDKNCDFCQKKYKEPKPIDLMLFLHAYKYKISTFEFQTKLPIWAEKEWTEM